MEEYTIKYVVYSPSGYGEWVAYNRQNALCGTSSSLEVLTESLQIKGQV
jgi:hypothetical protein